LLREHQAAWVQIDEPRFRTSIRQNYLPNVSFYYLRMHGQRADKWWHHEHRDERYDYLYTAKELQPFADIVDAVRRLTKKSYAYFNNHPAGKSVANALQLKHQLGQPIPRPPARRTSRPLPELATLRALAAPARETELFSLTPAAVPATAPRTRRRSSV
jgi:uncharacterized protein YecE (DUF72 family)